MTSSFRATWGMLLALGSAALGCEMSGAPDDDAVRAPRIGFGTNGAGRNDPLPSIAHQSN
jgi:hypothetical protein